MDVNRRTLQALTCLDDLVFTGNISKIDVDQGGTIYDFGVSTLGGLQAGLQLSRLLMADLAEVTLLATSGPLGTPSVQVHTDHPLWACIGSQYAGWPLQADDYFAMGSGPMRAVRGQEKVLEHYQLIGPSSTVIGGLEADKLPGEAVIEMIASVCQVAPSSVVLLVAPVTSLSGTVQVVARSVETALHKLHELNFDLRQIHSAAGNAPLPPPATDTLTGIGRTNDAILYGAEVTLWVAGDDDQLAQIGPQVPSHSSTAFGKPFVEIFRDHDHDFYKIDPMLFSPAIVRFVNLNSGRTFQFGQRRDDILRESFQLGETC